MPPIVPKMVPATTGSILAAVAAIITVPGASAHSRDNSYYRPGFVNPNLDNPLYHKNARNVLENLSSFRALYVKYENCAWANYGNPYAAPYEGGDNEYWGGGDGEGGGGGDGEDGQDGDNGNQVFRGCGYVGGEDGGESSHWYMGRTACFRAQAAYSLYGIPADGSPDSVFENEESPCRRATYINSFFTTMGVEAFAAPLGIDTTYGNAYCTLIPPADGVTVTYGDDDYYQDIRYNFQDFSSYGTGCSRGRFVTDSYQGAFCDGSDYTHTTDALDAFNAALDGLGCTPIYDASANEGFEYNPGDANAVDYVDEDGNAYYYANQEVEDMDYPVQMLEYSIACDVAQYPDSCPDPHGLLRKYKKALARALKHSDYEGKSRGEKVLNAVTGFLFFFAFLFVLSAVRKRRRVERSSKPKIDKRKLLDAPCGAAPICGTAPPTPENTPPRKSRSRSRGRSPSRSRSRRRSLSRSLSRKRTGESKPAADAAAHEADPQSSAHQRQPSAISLAAASVLSSVSSLKESVAYLHAPPAGGGTNDEVGGEPQTHQRQPSALSAATSAAASVREAVSYYSPGGGDDNNNNVLVHKITPPPTSKPKKKSGLFGRFRKS